MLLSNFRHWPQRREADCLVACTAMVLDYIGIHREYNWLARVLQTKAIGTPFHNLANLRNALGVHVLTAIDGSLPDFGAVLDSGLPIIVAVDSDVGNVWPYYENHAVVVIGFSKDAIFVNDPAVQEAPQEVASKTFLWAWSRRDYQYAIISLTEHA